MMIKTSELSGAALDWAVALTQGHITPLVVGFNEFGQDENGTVWFCDLFENNQPASWVPFSESNYSPSSDWAQCGPLIEECPTDLEWYGVDGKPLGWFATCEQGSGERYHGDTPKIAACRAIVAAFIGDAVEVPYDLIGGEV